MNPQYELPPEVAVEIAGYIRSGLFAPLVCSPPPCAYTSTCDGGEGKYVGLIGGCWCCMIGDERW